MQSIITSRAIKINSSILPQRIRLLVTWKGI
jgi:hypothetical protein